jgi:hypothetical protein
MQALSFLKIAAVAALMLVGVSVAAPAQAATGNWYDTANGPTMYQTNLWYNSGTMSPLVTPPVGAYVTSVYWTISLSYYPATTYAQLIAASSGHYWNLPSISGSGSGSTSIPANQNFYFRFAVGTPTTQTLSPPVYGGGHQLNVNYAY